MAYRSADMETDAAVHAGDANHYMLKTVEIFLDEYNSRDDVTDKFTQIGASLFIMFNGEVLLHMGTSTGWTVPTHRFKLEETGSIARICHKFFQNKAHKFEFEDTQLMEPAFKEPLLEPHSGEDPCLKLAIIVTLGRPPRWPDDVKAKMLPLDQLRNNMVKVNPIIGNSPHMDTIIKRINSFSRNHIFERFPQREEFLHMRMCFLLCHLEGWRLEKGDVHYYLGFLQRQKEPEAGFILFETSEHVLKTMVLSNPDGSIYETDDCYVLRGSSYRRATEPIETVLGSFTKDDPTLDFETSGRLRISRLSSHQADRLEELVKSGGYRYLVGSAMAIKSL